MTYDLEIVHTIKILRREREKKRTRKKLWLFSFRESSRENLREWYRL